MDWERCKIGVRDQREFLRLGKQSRRLPVLKILRTWLDCTLLFVERVTESRGTERRVCQRLIFILRKSSNREEARVTFSHNETPRFVKSVSFTCRTVTLRALRAEYDQWCNAALGKRLCARVDPYRSTQYGIPQTHKIACFVTRYMDLGHAPLYRLENIELPRTRERK